MISKITTTTATAEYSSVVSVPLNTLLVSAVIPSGPATYEVSGPVRCGVRPLAFELAIARMASAALVAPAPCGPTFTRTMVCMALPSADGMGPVTRPGPTLGSPAKLRASAAALARSAAVRPEARS